VGSFGAWEKIDLRRAQKIMGEVTVQNRDVWVCLSICPVSALLHRLEFVVRGPTWIIQVWAILAPNGLTTITGVDELDGDDTHP
jgi:hypothetical protein